MFLFKDKNKEDIKLAKALHHSEFKNESFDYVLAMIKANKLEELLS